MKSTNATAATYAKILSAAITDDRTMANVINSLLCVDEIASLNDFEAFVGQRLFEKLCDLRPDAVTLAQNGD